MVPSNLEEKKGGKTKTMAINLLSKGKGVLYPPQKKEKNGVDGCEF